MQLCTASRRTYCEMGLQEYRSWTHRRKLCTLLFFFSPIIDVNVTSQLLYSWGFSLFVRICIDHSWAQWLLYRFSCSQCSLWLFLTSSFKCRCVPIHPLLNSDEVASVFRFQSVRTHCLFGTTTVCRVMCTPWEGQIRVSLFDHRCLRRIARMRWDNDEGRFFQLNIERPN